MSRYLAIDYGRRRVGVAYSDPEHIIVSRSETILISSFKDMLRKLRSYITEHEISEIVIGYPIRQDGNRGDLCDEIDKLKSKLNASFPKVKIELLDERYSSQMAERYLHDLGLKVGDDKGRVDATAAGILLEDYLNKRRSET